MISGIGSGNVPPWSPIPWWDPNRVGLSVIAAYQAKGIPGYGKSLIDWSGNGNHLTEGNGHVPWNPKHGWRFAGAGGAKYFDTGLVPANTQAWSMVGQFANNVGNGMIAGCYDAGIRTFFWISPSDVGNRVYANGGNAIGGVAIAAGNMFVIGNAGYLNGAIDAAGILAWGAVSTRSIYIGARNGIGVPQNYITADVYALAIYNAGPAAVLGQRAAIVAAMQAI